MPASLNVDTQFGVAGGVNRDLAQHAIADNEAYYIQDCLLHRIGMTQRRGPIQAASGFLTTAAGRRIDGLGSVIDPVGVTKYCFLTNDGSKVQLTLTTADGTSSKVFDLATSGITSNTPPFVFDVKPAPGGGVLVGIGQQYAPTGANTRRFVFYWRGATKADYTTGTVTVTQGSRVITGAGTTWVGNIEPGMFLHCSADFVGVVKSVDSNTQITLEQNALMFPSALLSYSLTAYRGIRQNYATVGRITASTGSAIVNGGGTKFADQGIPLSAGKLFAQVGSDWVFLGNVSSINSNSQLTLAANSTTNVTNARYIFRFSADAGIGAGFGFLNAYWNGMQFTANQDSLLFGNSASDTVFVSTDSQLPDAIDLTLDGSWLKLPSVATASAITGLVPTETGLVVFRENETHLITGNSYTNLKSQKILDDGCYSTMAAVSYGNGVIWPGRKSVYRFDGVRVTDMLENKAKAYYQTALAGQDLEAIRWYAMEQNDHYILHSVYANSIQKTNNAVGTNQVWVFNLKTGALTFFSNLSLRGATKVPKLGTVYVWETDNTGPGIQGFFGLASDLFLENVGVSESLGMGWSPEASAGANPFIETKLYDAGNPEQGKRWKQFQLWSNTPAPVRVNVYLGLMKTNVLSNRTFAGSYGAWKNKLIRFNGAETHVAFTLDFASNNIAGTAQFGPMAILYKPLRRGRIKVS